MARWGFQPNECILSSSIQILLWDLKDVTVFVNIQPKYNASRHIHCQYSIGKSNSHLPLFFSPGYFDSLIPWWGFKDVASITIRSFTEIVFFFGKEGGRGRENGKTKP